MIQSIGQVMLYVNNPEAAAKFWNEKVGFERVERQEQGPQVSYVIAPKVDSDVQFVLHDKAAVAEMHPEMFLGIPSILMASTDVEKTYQEFIERGVNANPVMDLGFMKTFNFSDEEGNYYAVQEVK
ncbi:VOC family protein [Streptococcus suis]|uniref:VOC family protein n=1 Tax=Streptococcus suis TaxID=1307 RepID=UPI00209B5BD5|nr:VOC family protein [Streptococcus suis]MCO8230339.1 VOC family protein [Streptococcus suis]HEM3472304.1 VOC family protein [Streptococcus suis]HEM3476522.1 VOC family protein [Streptococcus suis]HEM3482985.1 VOC family protein [Streptococcus suis]HEM3549125.1 VOC family protein [Streptococcus suis]